MSIYGNCEASTRASHNPPLAPPYEGGEDVARRLVARDEHLCAVGDCGRLRRF